MGEINTTGGLLSSALAIRLAESNPEVDKFEETVKKNIQV